MAVSKIRYVVPVLILWLSYRCLEAVGVGQCLASSRISLAMAQELQQTIDVLTSEGKGILAADESISTVGKRLSSVNLENTEANRRALRELIFTTPGIEKYISGVILHEETLMQCGSDGERFVAKLQQAGIIPGIKVDLGYAPLPGGEAGEIYTLGLDTLQARCLQYYKEGARFAKWRAVFNIGVGMPSAVAVRTATDNLAKYALISQQCGLVPMVEPEVLSDGDHDISVCARVTEQVLSAVFRSLSEHRVPLECVILKPNMVLPGSSHSGGKVAAEVVAQLTVGVLRGTVPPAVPTIMFLSGGQSEEDSTSHLCLMNQMNQGPWMLSFSYGRALQASALKLWSGKSENVPEAQKKLMERALANSKATQGIQE